MASNFSSLLRHWSIEYLLLRHINAQCTTVTRQSLISSASHNMLKQDISRPCNKTSTNPGIPSPRSEPQCVYEYLLATFSGSLGIFPQSLKRYQFGTRTSFLSVLSPRVSKQQVDCHWKEVMLFFSH